MQITPAHLPQGDVRIYEFGARLDKEALQAVNEQIFKAHSLYNNIVACMRDTVRNMQAFLLVKAGPDAQATQRQVETLNGAFEAARATNDEDQMKSIALVRREAWRTLSAQLKVTRKTYRTELQTEFLNRIGKKSTSDTYQLRCAAVAEGLGWATANATLNAALIAFKTSFVLGKPPRFARAGDSTQDTLSLQFTVAGGVSVATLLQGKHTEFPVRAENGCGPRHYGSFGFRLGAASAGVYATGTWQYHRPLPTDGTVGLIRLVRRRIGPKTSWWVQFQVRSPLPRAESGTERKSLVAVHLGWAADLSGRRVAGIADAADPGLACILKLPPEIEAGLLRAAEIESERSVGRDTVVPKLKTHEWPESFLASASRPLDDLAPADAKITRAAGEVLALRRLPASHVAIRRLHRLAYLLRDSAHLPDWFEAWRKDDKLRWQEAAFAAKRARNRRKGFYRETALHLASNYSAIVMEQLDLAALAKKIDEVSGEHSDLVKKARAGRVVAAIYEFDGAIRWAATKCGTAVLNLAGETAQHCAFCGGHVDSDGQDAQILQCSECGAEVDRKRNGAALAWQAADGSLDELLEDFWLQTLQARESAASKRMEKQAKVQEARRASRGAATSAD